MTIYLIREVISENLHKPVVYFKDFNKALSFIKSASQSSSNNLYLDCLDDRDIN